MYRMTEAMYIDTDIMQKYSSEAREIFWRSHG